MTRIVVSPEAARDLQEASKWLAVHATRDLALDLGAEFLAMTKSIAQFPEGFPVYREARKAVLGRFRYTLYYDYDLDTDTATVVAFIHDSRHPEVTDERVK